MMRLWIAAAMACAMATACAPTGPRASEGSSPGERPGASRTLVLLARGEPPSLAARGFQQSGGNSNSYLAFNATLDNVDENGAPFPELAEALPQLNTDTWRVLSDGRMETIYQLKPDLVWHDGSPLTAEDFVFGWRVYATPALGTAAFLPVSQMEEVSAPDSRTLLIHWRTTYPGAALLKSSTQTEGFQALPRHVLESTFLQGDMDAVSNHPFWTREYVGLGPYRLVGWEPGANIDAAAFDQFVLGRPKIERMRIVFMADANAAVAALLSGQAHAALDYLLMYEQGSTLQQQWAASNGGTVLFSPLLIRISVLQFRPDTIATPALLDIRFRRALTSAMDRKTLNDTFVGGQAVRMDGYLSPLVPYYAAIEPAITKYPYDPRQAQQLLDEMGLQRGPEGFYFGPDRQPFSMEVMVLENPTQQSENAVIVEGYHRIGVNAVGRVLPVAQFGDGQNRASYTGMLTTGAPGFEPDMGRFTTEKISRPETRWQGLNYGAWSTPEYDRLWETYNRTLDRPQQIQQLAQMEKIISEQLPCIPMYYQPLITPYVADLVGPVLRTARTTDNTTHLQDWYWRS